MDRNQEQIDLIDQKKDEDKKKQMTQKEHE